MGSKSGTTVRAEIDADLQTLVDKWEGRGMPLLGSILRIVGWAYRMELEGSLETLCDTWIWSAEKLRAKTALRHGQPIPDPDGRARTPETARRHQRKYELLAGAAARERRTKTLRAKTRRR